MLGRLMLLPAAVVSVVVAVPFVWGDHPVTLSAVTGPAKDVASSLGVRIGTDHPDLAGVVKVQPKPTPPPGPRVENPWRPGDVQRGIQVYWKDDGASAAVVAKRARTTVDYVVGLHANALSVSFPFYTKNRWSSRVGPRTGTPSAQRMQILVEEARKAGLRVTLRPILDEKSLDPPVGWRGNIKPKSPSDWFNSYLAMLWPYLGLAEREGVATVSFGTELNSMERSGYWKWLVKSARKRFSGELAYDANWDSYALRLKPPKADVHGVDAYFPAYVDADADVKDLVTSWNRWLDKHSKGKLPDILFSEVGIGTWSGAYTKPSSFSPHGSYDPTIQPTWYEAVCRVTKDRRVGGIYFWKVDFGDGAHTKIPTERGHLDFTGYPASEGAIRACFDSL
ncbi:glycoside hydrolase family 113 [Spongisporangium articulatum]|uniref:Glycoside hydrolase family 113 n=1 Tax=Spongisporangium articulatum TaxID=3362603 RepID=A0ABW8ATX0_9ACTN